VDGLAQEAEEGKKWLGFEPKLTSARKLSLHQTGPAGWLISSPLASLSPIAKETSLLGLCFLARVCLCSNIEHEARPTLG